MRRCANRCVGVTLPAAMNMIAILLCALASQVKSQTKENSDADILPAKILVQEKTIGENSNFYVTCSTYGRKKTTDVHVYLCKDGQGIKKRLQKLDQNDITFTMSRVGLNGSGNYSCVYSIKEYSPSNVTMEGDDPIPIRVIANILPADISGPSTVSEGDNAELRCTISGTLQTLGDCQLIYSYLIKNGRILQVKAFEVTRKEVQFTIEPAMLKDSGHYSCVVLPSKCIQEHEKTLRGNNIVSLKVEDTSVLRVIFSSFGGITMISSLVVCLWCIHKRVSTGKSPFSNNSPQAASQQANADMLEEQQESIEGEDLEAQNVLGQSLRMEEEENEYDVANEDFYPDDYDGVYSVADEVPARPNPAKLYATSFKHKKYKTRSQDSTTGN